MVKEARLFTNTFLDAWYELSPDTYMTAHEAYDGAGNEMIRWLVETNKDLYDNICKRSIG